MNDAASLLPRLPDFAGILESAAVQAKCWLYAGAGFCAGMAVALVVLWLICDTASKWKR